MNKISFRQLQRVTVTELLKLLPCIVTVEGNPALTVTIHELSDSHKVTVKPNVTVSDKDIDDSQKSDSQDVMTAYKQANIKQPNQPVTINPNDWEPDPLLSKEHMARKRGKRNA